jgi:hypothetical protein
MPEETAVKVVIRLDAGHDRNGNPRRVFVVLNEHSDIVAAYDEEYRGKGALPEELRGVNYPTLATTPGEYRQLVKEHTKR